MEISAESHMWSKCIEWWNMGCPTLVEASRTNPLLVKLRKPGGNTVRARELECLLQDDVFLPSLLPKKTQSAAVSKVEGTDEEGGENEILSKYGRVLLKLTEALYFKSIYHNMKKTH